jgi:transposase-like protein
MPYDPHADDEDESPGDEAGEAILEFDCPACSANNPYGDGFRDGDEVRCSYCGQDFEVRVGSSGRLKFREI